MNILLTPELAEIINRKVESGLYNSANEVVREGLRLLQEQDELRKMRRENLRREVQKGVDAVKDGRFTAYDSADEMIEDVIGQARAEFETAKRNGK